VRKKTIDEKVVQLYANSDVPFNEMANTLSKESEDDQDDIDIIVTLNTLGAVEKKISDFLRYEDTINAQDMKYLVSALKDIAQVKFQIKESKANEKKTAKELPSSKQLPDIVAKTKKALEILQGRMAI